MVLQLALNLAPRLVHMDLYMVLQVLQIILQGVPRQALFQKYPALPLVQDLRPERTDRLACFPRFQADHSVAANSSHRELVEQHCAPEQEADPCHILIWEYLDRTHRA
jgi:hypothetical protein